MNSHLDLDIDALEHSMEEMEHIVYFVERYGDEEL